MNNADYLNELKNHDWTYSYADGEPYRRGRDNQARLEALKAGNDELCALYTAYSAFIWKGGEEPNLDIAATNAKAQTEKTTAAPLAKQERPKVRTYNKQAIMQDAWKIARKATNWRGGKAIDHIANALRQAWAKAKAKALSGFHTTNRHHAKPKATYYICVDEKIGRNTRQINQPVIDEVFTDRGEALAALQILSSAFTKPFIKTSRHYRLC